MLVFQRILGFFELCFAENGSNLKWLCVISGANLRCGSHNGSVLWYFAAWECPSTSLMLLEEMQLLVVSQTRSGFDFVLNPYNMLCDTGGLGCVDPTGCPVQISMMKVPKTLLMEYGFGEM